MYRFSSLIESQINLIFSHTMIATKTLIPAITKLLADDLQIVMEHFRFS